MIAEATATRRSNWKLYVVAITCVCFVAGMLVNGVSESGESHSHSRIGIALYIYPWINS